MLQHAVFTMFGGVSPPIYADRSWDSDHVISSDREAPDRDLKRADWMGAPAFLLLNAGSNA